MVAFIKELRRDHPEEVAGDLLGHFPTGRGFVAPFRHVLGDETGEEDVVNQVTQGREAWAESAELANELVKFVEWKGFGTNMPRAVVLRAPTSLRGDGRFVEVVGGGNRWSSRAGLGRGRLEGFGPFG